MALLYPSLLATPEETYNTVIKQLEPLCPGFHIDIMDNKFVPNQGISVAQANRIAQLTYRQLWVHLMVEEPERYFDTLNLPPQTLLTFHIESHKHTSRTIKEILEKKWLPGIAIKPKTGVNEIMPFLESIHHVLIMSVEPGFSGQPFLADTLAKIDPLVGYRQTGNLHFKIAIDGGVNQKNIHEITQKGVDQLAIGSALFEAKVGPVKAYELFAHLAQ